VVKGFHLATIEQQDPHENTSVRSKGKGVAAKVPTSPLLSDPSRFDDFYRRYFLPLVRRATWKHRLEKEDARDVVQEAFIVALIKLDPQRNPKAWLIQVVDHLSVNFQRKLVRRAKLVSKWSPTDAGVATGTGIADIADNYNGSTDLQGGDD
jgi:DNA-directed RNA polymerase specialized sigma24 family protein